MPHAQYAPCVHGARRRYGTEVVEALGPVESCAALLVDPDDGSRAFLDRKEAIEAALKPGDIMMLEPSGHRWALPTPYKDITAPLSTTASLRYRASRSGAGTAAKTSYDGRGGASGHDSRRSSRNGGDQQLPQAQQPQRGVYYDSASESVRRVRRSDKGKHKRGAGAGASAPVLPEDEYP